MKQSKKIALCGLCAGASITILLLGFMIPFATYACPAIAACILLPIVYEYKEKTAFTMYLAVSFLGLFLVPDKELILIYILVFGLYTVFKFKIDRIKPILLRFGFKIIFALITTLIVYSILLIIFPNPLLLNEFSDMGTWMLFLFFGLFVLTFLIYDFAATRIFLVYYYRVRPKIFKNAKR